MFTMVNNYQKISPVNVISFIYYIFFFVKGKIDPVTY